MTGRVVSAALYGILGLGWIIGEGVELVPDTASYAHGGSAWSSPFAAIAGLVAGRAGLRVIGLVGALALGWIVASFGGTLRALLLLLALVVSPVPFAFCASPDALAAALTVVAYAWSRRDGRAGWWVAFFHLEAALCLLVGGAVQRVLRVRTPAFVLVAGVGAIVALAILDRLLGVTPTELQLRYLLPGLAVYATFAGRGQELEHGSRLEVVAA